MTAKQPENKDPLIVYGFTGSVMIPTPHGAYWATAVGGRVLSRPTGNPFLLFSLEYLWDVAGMPLEFPEPIKIRLNTMLAVTESIDFAFPAPEIEPEQPADQSIPATIPVLVDGNAAAQETDDFRDELDEDEYTEDEDEDPEDEYVDEDELDAEVSELPYE